MGLGGGLVTFDEGLAARSITDRDRAEGLFRLFRCRSLYRRRCIIAAKRRCRLTGPQAGQSLFGKREKGRGR